MYLYCGLSHNLSFFLTGPTHVGSFAFIQEGWSREWNKSKSYESESIVGEITLTPTGSTKTKKV